jgi:hypothetical protein
MRRVVASPLIIGIILACSGCADQSPPQAKPVVVNYEIRDPAGGFAKGTGSFAGITAGGDTLKLEIKDARVWVSGKDGGTLMEGDSVLLDKDGRLTVNGQPREPK